MAIARVSLRLQSSTLGVESLENLAGETSTRGTEKGAPVSSRRPDGPVFEASSVVFERPGAFDSLGAYIDALAPILDRLKAAHPGSGDVVAVLSVMVTARSLGFVVWLDPEHVAVLAAASCGIAIDCYEDENDV